MIIYQIQYHTQLLPEYYPRPNGNDHWRLAADFLFSVNSEQHKVPEGFWFDFASVPRLLWTLISPYDLGVGPLPHDFGYRTGTHTRLYWDQVFAACMEKDQIAAWKRHAAYRAVRWFGGFTWREPTLLPRTDAAVARGVMVSPKDARAFFDTQLLRRGLGAAAPAQAKLPGSPAAWRWNNDVQLLTA